MAGKKIGAKPFQLPTKKMSGIDTMKSVPKVKVTKSKKAK